jgi:hypothetical protein
MMRAVLKPRSSIFSDETIMTRFKIMNTAGKEWQKPPRTHLKIVKMTRRWECVLHFKVLKAQLHCLPKRQFYFINTDTVSGVRIGVEWRLDHSCIPAKHTTTYWNRAILSLLGTALDAATSQLSRVTTISASNILLQTAIIQPYEVPV